MTSSSKPIILIIFAIVIFLIFLFVLYKGFTLTYEK